MHPRHPRLPFRSLIAGASAFGLVLALSPAAGASTAAHPTLTRAAVEARAAAAARSAIEHMHIGQHATAHLMPGHAVRTNATTQVSSTNWSGYVDGNTAGNTYSTVTGQWTEPAVTCSGLGLEQLAAFWVGIDGYNSSSVEQDGTLAECYLGSVYYYTWWEMYPSNSVQEVGSSVQPGDSITASVVRTGTSYKLTVTDATHPANSFSTTQTCSDCANASAEWIAEAPSSTTGVLPLADFHSWTESGATVVSGSDSGVISTFPNDEITMTDSLGRVKAQPGALNSSGNGFTVTWERSS
jgi:Peptidase A4 family